MLTERQRDTFLFIQEYRRQRGYAPKLTEIADGIGICSKGVVHRYLRAIAAEGLITVVPGRHRGIQLTDGSPGNSNEWTLPMIGKIAAGRPIEVISDDATFNVADYFLGPNRFVLRVQGDSMIEAGILDRDMVIVEQRDYADDGDIVVAVVDNNEATLKRLHKTNDGQIMLIPANQTMQTMSYAAERIQIQGVVVGQLRAYRTRRPTHTMNR